MARATNNSQLWSQLSQVYRGGNKGGGNSTTLNGAVAAGASTFTVQAAGTIATGMILRLSSGSDAEIVQVASIAGAVVTPRWALYKAHASGDAVIEQAKTNLGPTTDDGVTTDLDADMTVLNAGTRRLFMGLNLGHFRPIFQFGLKNFNQENFAFSLGIPETNVAGTSVFATDPRRLYLDDTKLGTDVDLWVGFTGVLHDTLTNVEVQVWGAEVDWSKAFKSKYKLGGDDFVIPVELSPAAGAIVLSGQ